MIAAPRQRTRLMTQRPTALDAGNVSPRIMASNYPEPFASMMAGRIKRPLGDVFGLSSFGVNLTTLMPGAVSSVRHAHSLQDEFIYVLSGHITLHTNAGLTDLRAGMCAGFPAGTGDAHRLINRSDSSASYLEIGDRTAGDIGTYPDDDLVAERVGDAWRFFHKDGTPYP